MKSPSHITLLVYVLGVFTALLVCAFICRPRIKKEPLKKDVNHSASCEAKTCGALDPVSDPDYNIKEIIKQSILLEQHIADKNKRCKDCILKHILHCQALSEEAIMLAGESVDRYPLMDQCLPFYSSMLKTWLDGPSQHELQEKTQEPTLMSMETQLREWRKKLMAEYYQTGGGTSSNR